MPPYPAGSDDVKCNVAQARVGSRRVPGIPGSNLGPADLWWSDLCCRTASFRLVDWPSPSWNHLVV